MRDTETFRLVDNSQEAGKKKHCKKVWWHVFPSLILADNTRALFIELNEQTYWSGAAMVECILDYGPLLVVGTLNFL